MQLEFSNRVILGWAIPQYGSLKTDIPGTPLPKGGTRMSSKSPLLSGDAARDLRGINMLSEPYWAIPTLRTSETYILR